MHDLVFEVPLGQRYHRYGVGIRVLTGDLWWSFDLRVWVEGPSPGSSSHAPCRTLRAFKRHLRKHPELAGHDVIWCNRYYDVKAVPIRPYPN